MKKHIAALFVLLLMTVFSPRAAAYEGSIHLENYVQNTSCEYVSERDAMPGESILCRAEIQVSITGTCVLHGRLDSGLSLDRVLHIACNEKELNASYYTLTTSRLVDGCAFEIHLAENFTDEKNVCLEVIYTIHLNSDSTVNGANCLEVVLEQNGEEHSGEKAEIKTWSILLYRGIRTLGSDEHINAIEGACFMITREGADQKRLVFAETEPGVYKVCKENGCPHIRHSAVVRTPCSGFVQLEGLSEGIYRLDETKMPSGYEPLSDPVIITIDKTGSVRTECASMENGILCLINTVVSSDDTAAEWDSLNFYRIGCVIILGIGAVLLRRFGIPVGFISFPSDEKEKRRGSRRIPLR